MCLVLEIKPGWYLIFYNSTKIIESYLQDGCIYIFGGALDGKFRTRCNLLQRMWLQPPSLQYFAQRAVLASLPRLFEKILDSLTLSDPQKLFKIAYGYQNDKEREFGSFFNNVLYFGRIFFGNNV